MERHAPAKAKKTTRSSHISPRSVRSPSVAHPLFAVQRSIGNQNLQRLIRSPYIQSKLEVSTPGDKSEQEADRVADSVMRMPAPQSAHSVEEVSTRSQPRSIQRACVACEVGKNQGRKAAAVRVHRKVAAVQLRKAEDDEQVHQGASAPAMTPSATPKVGLKSGGSAMSPATRAFFEPRFGKDFRQVRIHTDTPAAETARSLNARAFTIGENIAFARGQYAPESHAGRKLLAHELTHVVQQSSAGTRDTMAARYVNVATEDRAKVPAAGIGRLAGTPQRSIGPASAPIQRNIFSDLWHGVTEAAPAVANVLRLVATLIQNPARLPSVLAAITWEIIPDSLKGPIIDRILQACLTLAENVEVPSLPGIPSIGTIIKHLVIGFLRRALSYPTGMKIRVANRIQQIVLAPSAEFTIGFLKGFVLGLWDGITGPFILIWDLIKIAYEICEAQIKFIGRLLDGQQRQRFANEAKTAITQVKQQVAVVIAQLRSGRTNPLAILRFIDQLVQRVLQQVQSYGASLADAMLRFMNKPDRELGESLGWLEGTVTFEVLLLVLTEGGYTVLKNGLQGLKVVVRLIQMGERAWEALLPVRAALAGFRAFARANRALAPLLEAVEGVFGLLVKFLRFSFGIGGPGGAGARGAGHAGETAERTAAREIHVADTATRESHEITLLADGRLIRCSDRCVQMAESILQRSSRFEASALEKEGLLLNQEARQLSQEARALKANEGLSAAERETREAALMQRGEALERQMAAAEQQLMNSLSESAGSAVESLRTLRRNNATNTRLSQFDHELDALERDLARNRALAAEQLDPEMRQLIEGEFRDLQTRTNDLERRMRGELPAAGRTAEVPEYVRQNRVPTDAETFLADGSRFTRTGKNIKGAQIYRGSDGRYYHRDTLHVGTAAEIEFYDAQAKHLGTMNPITGAVTGGPVKGRTLERYL